MDISNNELKTKTEWTGDSCLQHSHHHPSAWSKRLVTAVSNTGHLTAKSTIYLPDAVCCLQVFLLSQ